MNLQLKIILLLALLINGQSLTAQVSYSKFEVNEQMTDTFSFAKKWDYSWNILKDEATGRLESADDHALTAEDTAHLFYTANCSTNVQGGYNIRYGFAEKKQDLVTLCFSDGLPAYASRFYLFIQGDSFYFKPEIILPQRKIEQEQIIEINEQKLILNKKNYRNGDIIMGYADIEFTEITVSVNSRKQQKKFYMRGYFRTRVKQGSS
ncbi:hypothetical protein [Foetidibacter luteolus]|uniref:hypothetical protein n=1 Tax=Foetidibacter luteolus TaxID=2608880 RepID=UPI00129B99C9|nr:hypothetical protein [Foetidibacter luteolus]